MPSLVADAQHADGWAFVLFGFHRLALRLFVQFRKDPSDRADVARGALVTKPPFDKPRVQLAVGRPVAKVDIERPVAEREALVRPDPVVGCQRIELLRAWLSIEEHRVDDAVLVRAREGIVGDRRSEFVADRKSTRLNSSQ